MLSQHRRAGHSIASAILFVVAVYTIVSGTLAMTGDRTCAGGWEATWRVFPPGWVCERPGP